jgi:hypothetical protein
MFLSARSQLMTPATAAYIPAAEPATAHCAPTPLRAVSTDIMDFRVRVDVSVTNTRISVGS